MMHSSTEGAGEAGLGRVAAETRVEGRHRGRLVACLGMGAVVSHRPEFQWVDLAPFSIDRVLRK